MNPQKRILKHIVLILLYHIVLVSFLPAKTFARRLFYLQRPKMGIRINYDFTDEERKGPNINTKTVSQDFKEYLSIGTRGYVYHPLLLEFTLNVQPNWQQKRVENNSGSSGSSSASSQNYSLNTRFLKNKPYSFSFFAHRTDSTLKSAFAQRSDTATESYGVSASLKNRVLPTSLLYRHERKSQKGFYSSTEKEDEFRIAAQHRKGGSVTKLSSTYTDFSRFVKNRTTRKQFFQNVIQNDYNFTEDERIVLSSHLRHNLSDSGNNSTSDFGLSENLSWKHRENLSSNYHIGYSKSDSGSFHTRNKNFDLGLTHLLYENLATTISGHGSTSDFQGGSIDRYGGNLNFNYHRRIPGGIINTTARFDYRRTDRAYATNENYAQDENHVLKTGDLTLLNNENVDIDSIQITNAAGTTIFAKDVDYEVQTIGTSVRIIRDPFGAIADGDTVLVSYSYFADPSFDGAVLTQAYAARLSLLSGLALSYNYSHTKQKILSGPSPQTVTDDVINSASATYRWKWTDTKFSYANTKTTSGSSNTTWQAEERLTFRPTTRLFLNFSGNFEQRKFENTSGKEDFFSLNSTIDWLPENWCKLSLTGSRDVSSGPSTDRVNSAISTRFEMSLGIWQGVILYRISREADNLNGEERQLYNLNIQIVRMLF